MKKPHQLRLLVLASLVACMIAACKTTVVKPSYTIDSSTSITAGYGDTITIKGTNLQSATGFTIVRLNGQIFSIVNSSNGYVQVRVPKFAGDGQFTVSINGQTYNGPKFTYQYRGIVTTFAGSGMPGNTDGQGIAASFNQPWGLALDTGGNLYVADGGNRAIRKITPGGLVSTVATLGTAPLSSFEYPYNIAINNNTHVLYVTDFNTGSVFEVNADNSTNIVSVIAGGLSGIAVGNDGSIYAGNYNIGTIVQVDPNGQLNANFSKIGSPRSLVFDKAGTLYASGIDPTTNLHAAFKISSTGVATVLFDDPNFRGYDIAVDQNGNVFESNFLYNNIRIVDKNGNASPLAGNGSFAAGNKDGVGAAASFDGPHGIVCDANGNLYVSTFNASTGGGLIRKIVVQ